MSKDLNNIEVCFDNTCKMCSTFANVISNQNNKKITLTSTPSPKFKKEFKSSIIVTETGTNQSFVGSEGLIEIGKRSNGQIKWIIYFFSLLPRNIRNFTYKIISKNRSKISRFLFFQK